MRSWYSYRQHNAVCSRICHFCVRCWSGMTFCLLVLPENSVDCVALYEISLECGLRILCCRCCCCCFRQWICHFGIEIDTNTKLDLCMGESMVWSSSKISGTESYGSGFESDHSRCVATLGSFSTSDLLCTYDPSLCERFNMCLQSCYNNDNITF